MYGHCPPNKLCDRCVEDGFAQMKGVAEARGFFWAEEVAHHIDRSRPWPSSPKATAIALRKVADITDDERLRARLAAEVERAAAKAWASANR